MASQIIAPRKQRTRQHVIADLSVHHVEGFILEEGHTAQRLGSDYGYDLLMHTFDEDGYAEPGSVYFQLKAAETLHMVGPDYVFDVDIRDYNLWMHEEMPVILILFDVSRKAAFWLAIQRYFQEDANRQPKKGRQVRARPSFKTPVCGSAGNPSDSRLETPVASAEIGSSIMKKSDITFGQLDQVLRAYGFTCRPGKRKPPGHIYVHEKAGAMIMLPAFRKRDRIYEHHLLAARMELDHFGIADPTTFDKKLQKAG